MDNDKFIRLETLRDVEIKLREAELDGMIIPRLVYELLQQVEDSYDKELPLEVINELTEKN